MRKLNYNWQWIRFWDSVRSVRFTETAADEITDDNSRKRTRGESVDKSARRESRVLVTVVIKRDAGRFRPPGFSDPNYHRASTMPRGRQEGHPDKKRNCRTYER